MRIQSIDILRGIAILGILLMNIYFHGILTLGYTPFPSAITSDGVVDIFNAIFVDGRFRCLFCILFGTGLAIQIQSCKRNKLAYPDFLKSRLHWLMLFGFMHGVFIFGGDVLLLYSICALVLIRRLSLPTRQLYRLSIRWLTIGAALNALIVMFILLSPEDTIQRGSVAFFDEYNRWMGNYQYQLIIQFIVLVMINLLASLFLFWQVAGLMLLGVYFYRIGFYKRGLTPRNYTRVMLAAVIFISIDILLRIFAIPIGSEVGMLTASISAIFVAVLYAHWVIKLLRYRPSLLTIFIAPGRMAFSLYILQSLAMAVVLRWIVPDFHLTATMVDYVAIAMAFILVQLVLAHGYFKLFNQGPLEYLWRRLYLNSFTKKQQRHAGE